MLLSLDTSKASGPDNISARMLKSTSSSISTSITILFNMSISYGDIPEEWKTSTVIPIPNKGGGNCPSHYRPISLLCVLSKLLEKHIYKIILQQLNYPLSSHQWGFFTKKINSNCTLGYFPQLVSITECW